MNALDVVCPICAAKVGHDCYAYSTERRQIVGWRKPHVARVRAAGEFEARLSAAYAEASRG